MHGHKIALYYAAETTSGGTYNNIVSLCASDMALFAKPVEDMDIRCQFTVLYSYYCHFRLSISHKEQISKTLF